jgi:hypothetical protein
MMGDTWLASANTPVGQVRKTPMNDGGLRCTLPAFDVLATSW